MARIIIGQFTRNFSTSFHHQTAPAVKNRASLPSAVVDALDVRPSDVHLR